MYLSVFVFLSSLLHDHNTKFFKDVKIFTNTLHLRPVGEIDNDELQNKNNVYKLYEEKHNHYIEHYGTKNIFGANPILNKFKVTRDKVLLNRTKKQEIINTEFGSINSSTKYIYKGRRPHDLIRFNVKVTNDDLHADIPEILDEFEDTISLKLDAISLIRIFDGLEDQKLIVSAVYHPSDLSIYCFNVFATVNGRVVDNDHVLLPNEYIRKGSCKTDFDSSAKYFGFPLVLNYGDYIEKPMHIRGASNLKVKLELVNLHYNHNYIVRRYIKNKNKPIETSWLKFQKTKEDIALEEFDKLKKFGK